MKVQELICLLQKYPQDLHVGLCVYGHTYNSADHKLSHGELTVKQEKSNYGTPSIYIRSGESDEL
jgi:hypothetical protein